MKKITEKDVLNFYRENLRGAGQITLREAAGTLHHPRPVLVVLVGEKVG